MLGHPLSVQSILQGSLAGGQERSKYNKRSFSSVGPFEETCKSVTQFEVLLVNAYTFIFSMPNSLESNRVVV